MPPPLGPTMIFFKATLCEKVRFCRFQARIAKFNNVWWSFYTDKKSPCEIVSDMTLWFSAFPNFRKKWANLRLPLNVQKQKVFQLQGGFALLTPQPGALPLDPDGGSASRPTLIGSRSARSLCTSTKNDTKLKNKCFTLVCPVRCIAKYSAKVYKRLSRLLSFDMCRHFIF